MTEKNGETPSKEQPTPESKMKISIEGAEALFEEALAAIDGMGKGKASQDEAPAPESTNVKASEKASEAKGTRPASDDTVTPPREMVAVPDATAKRLEELEAALASNQERLRNEEAERKKVYEQLLRATAEFDNFRKRTQREKEEHRKYGNKEIMSDLLDVVDNFERALSTLNDADAAVREGISMVHRQLLDVLTRYGAKRFDSLGEPFDYTQHQAISIFETPERPPQIVYDVFKEGYLLHDILLRPAMVIVTKAPAAKSNTDEATGEKAKAEAEDLDSSKEDTTSENAS